MSTKIKVASKYAIPLTAIILTIFMTSLLPLSGSPAECFTSTGQIVVKWKDEYRFCRQWWNIRCMWPIQRRHTTYKVTITQGTPVRDERGNLIPVANGKRRKWLVYDSIAWNQIGNIPAQKKMYPGYETIADNEYVVMVETRYRLFHNVEANLRICTQKP